MHTVMKDGMWAFEFRLVLIDGIHLFFNYPFMNPSIHHPFTPCHEQEFNAFCSTSTPVQLL
jgi:hypothetical protein